VQGKVYDAFVERFVAQVGKLNSGNGLESNCDIGPLISNKAMDKVQLIVTNASYQKNESVYRRNFWPGSTYI